MVARRIYLTILILSVVLGIYFYGIAPDKYSPNFLIFFALVPFLLFMGGVHGLAAHLLRPEVKDKGGSMSYLLIMGLVYSVLFLIHVFLILPLVCPSFLDSFK
jgi:hypothetical protein